MKAALRFSNENYFKYDPFKHGVSKKTELPQQYISRIDKRDRLHQDQVFAVREATMPKIKPTAPHHQRFSGAVKTILEGPNQPE